MILITDFFTKKGIRIVLTYKKCNYMVFIQFSIACLLGLNAPVLFCNSNHSFIGDIKDIITGEKEAVIISPYEGFYEYNHPVQLHTHTTNSDGRLTPAEMMKAHARSGYVGCAITDHDHPDGIYNPCIEDPGGHNIIFIPGVEYSVGYHLQGVGINEIYYKGEDRRQEQIDQIIADGGIAFWSHPAREDIRGVTYTGLDRHKNYSGLEIFTQNCRPPRYSPEKADYVLAELGRRVNIFSTSDTHRGAQVFGYVNILSNIPREQLTSVELMDALRSGRFYSIADSGVAFGEHPSMDDEKQVIPAEAAKLSIKTKGNEIHIESDRAVDIEFITNRHNYYYDGVNYSQINHDVTSAIYKIDPSDKYIRIKAISKDGNARTWSNPLYIEKK